MSKFNRHGVYGTGFHGLSHAHAASSMREFPLSSASASMIQNSTARPIYSSARVSVKKYGFSAGISGETDRILLPDRRRPEGWSQEKNGQNPSDGAAAAFPGK